MERRKHGVRCEGCPAFKKTTGKNISQPVSLPRSDVCVLAPPARIPAAASGRPASLLLQFEAWAKNFLAKMWAAAKGNGGQAGGEGDTLPACRCARLPSCLPSSLPHDFSACHVVSPNSPSLSLFARYLEPTHKRSNYPFSGQGKLRHVLDCHHLFAGMDEHEAKPHPESIPGQERCRL